MDAQSSSEGSYLELRMTGVLVRQIYGLGLNRPPILSVYEQRNWHWRWKQKFG